SFLRALNDICRVIGSADDLDDDFAFKSVPCLAGVRLQFSKFRLQERFGKACHGIYRYVLASSFERTLRKTDCGRALIWDSPKRSTDQPFRLKARSTCRSRSMLRSILARQKAFIRDFSRG